MDQSAEPGVPIPEDEDERLADLYSYDILESAPEGTYQDLTRLARQICDRPMAAITFIDEDRQWVKAEVGGGAHDSPRTESFCAHAIVDPEEVFVVEDASWHPEFEDNPYVVGEPHLRFYAGAPIRSSRGNGLGTVCVLDTEPGKLSDDEARALKSLSRQAALSLKLNRLGRRLELANQDFERLAGALDDEAGELVTEIVDALAVVQAENPALGEEVDERLAGARSTAQDLAAAIGELHSYATVAGAKPHMDTFALREALADARDQLTGTTDGGGGAVEAHGLPVIAGDRDQIETLFERLLATIIEHAGADPTVHVTAHRSGEDWQIDATADGLSFDAGDPDELFELPTAKTRETDHGPGLVLCKRIVERHGGEIGIEGGNGGEASVWFTLPGPDDE